ncbi:MAG: glutamate--tRNA ligase [Chloroflexi bacterium]|nr:glutamate--tRNA ligase [Chloroflexota bacterium]
MSLPNTVRVRFAPSPTGMLHVGGLRSALFNWLFARHSGGTFILRIEDTDRKRYDPRALPDLLESLRWLGLDWDEGPEVGGEYGPYFQSQRTHLYGQYARQLLDSGDAYYCFCTSARQAGGNPEQTSHRGAATGYDRRCRTLDARAAAERVAEGESAVIRLKMPLEGRTTFHDLIRGDISVDNGIQDDVVLLKSDGYPTYHLANVVDDHLMRITHIMRADEWIATAPRHVQLYKALGWQMPAIAHLPVVLDPSGKGKMSKRKKVAADGRVLPVHVRDFREAGYLPEALFNFLALIGWHYDDHTELMTRQEIVDRFSIERINPAAAAFNYAKLDNFNGVYIRGLTVEELTDRLMPFVVRAGFHADRQTLLRITPLVRERMERLDQIAGLVDFFFAEQLADYDPLELIPKKADAAEACRLLASARELLAGVEPFDHDSIERALRGLAERLDVKAGQLFQPIRVAVCGRLVAPPLFGTLEVMGRECALKRIDQALGNLAALAPLAG